MEKEKLMLMSEKLMIEIEELKREKNTDIVDENTIDEKILIHRVD